MIILKMQNKILLTQWFSFLVIALLMLVTGCNLQEDPLSIAPDDHVTPAGAQTLPFSGKIVGSFVATPTTDTTVYLSVAHANGIATHIGKFTKVTSDTVNLATLRIGGSFIMTVASGDQLSGVYSGSFAFGPQNTMSWILNSSFTGGTGRFAHARGDFVFLGEGHYSINNGIVYCDYAETFNGNIIY
jgi:predicted small lipoprotein YifL